MPTPLTPTQIEISTDPHRLDRAMIHGFLASSYWARNIPLSVVEKSIEHSLCFGAYADNRQVGFARVITDSATFAYLADVFVVPDQRGCGIASRLLHAVMHHETLQGLRRWMLATKDAHALYARFGFQPLSSPADFMTVHQPGIYGAPS
jgi:GNAT superfamily N-acetyltransferase